MNLERFEDRWLPALAALVRAHLRLVPPGLVLHDREVACGLEWHAHWPFYTPGLSASQVLLATQGRDVLAALQLAWAGAGWGYGARPDDGPPWLRSLHPVIAWLYAWPGDAAAADAMLALLERALSLAREEGWPGLEAFRGGPGCAPVGCQLSSRWPHLWPLLSAAGFGEPRALLVYSGETSPEGLPPAPELPEGVTLRFRASSLRPTASAAEQTADDAAAAETGVAITLEPQPARERDVSLWGRVTAWCEGESVGICDVQPLGAAWTRDIRGPRSDGGRRRRWDQWGWDDPRAGAWGVVRRLVVMPRFRGRDIGASLLHAQLTRLAAHGRSRYVLHTLPAEAEVPARALFTRFGATVIDTQCVLRRAAGE